jgi:hypothetical protein
MVGILIFVLLTRSWYEAFIDCRATSSIGSVEGVMKPATGERDRRLFLFQIFDSIEWDERYERTPGWRLVVLLRLEGWRM